MTLKEAARHLEIPESTLRLYRDEFEDQLPVRGEGRRRRFESDALELLSLIIAKKRDGWSAVRIREELARRRRPAERTHHRTVAERLDDILALLKGQELKMESLRAEIAALRTEVQRAQDKVVAFEDAAG